MFIGHFAPAIALASRRDSPGLATLCLGAQFVDIAFFGFVLTGVEKMRLTPGITRMMPLDLYHMPYTHSLVGTLVFAVLFACLVFFSVAPDKRKPAAAIGAIAVLSHWFLDVLVHSNDMTLAGGNNRFGLALWNNPALEIPLELGLVGASIWLYFRATKPVRRSSNRSLWLFLGLLVLMQIINWFGPAPQSVTLLSVMALFSFALVCGAAFFVQRGRRYM
jgi:membrane-bound metal-dependent hydrolase YbcI (DUF457 family)